MKRNYFLKRRGVSLNKLFHVVAKIRTAVPSVMIPTSYQHTTGTWKNNTVAKKKY